MSQKKRLNYLTYGSIPMTWIEKNADNPDKDFKRGSHPQQVSHPMIGWVKKIFAERRFKQPPYLFQQQQKKKKSKSDTLVLEKKKEKKMPLYSHQRGYKEHSKGSF